MILSRFGNGTSRRQLGLVHGDRIHREIVKHQYLGILPPSAINTGLSAPKALSSTGHAATNRSRFPTVGVVSSDDLTPSRLWQLVPDRRLDAQDSIHSVRKEPPVSLFAANLGACLRFHCNQNIGLTDRWCHEPPLTMMHPLLA